MKAAYRYQFCETDCFPMSVLNGLAHLYDRRYIPGAVIQRVYFYCLDSVGPDRTTGGGTEEASARLLVEWLNAYRTAHFRPRVEYWNGRDVRFAPGSKLRRALAGGAVAVCDVSERRRWWHSILLLRVEDGWIECWDPYVRARLTGMKGRAEVLESDGGKSANLRISVRCADASRSQSFGLGPVRARQALVMWTG